MSDPALFSVSSETSDGLVVVRPVGELDVAAVPEMDAELDRVLDGAAQVEIDMRDVTFVDSSGLRLLLSARQRCTDAGGTMLVTNPGEDTRRLLDLTGLSPLLLP